MELYTGTENFLLFKKILKISKLDFQFWACCGCSLALMNVLCACLSLPPLLAPLSLIYLMSFVVPVLSITLVRTDNHKQAMQRATGKKQTKFDSNVFLFVMCCYGCKFLPTIVIMVCISCFEFAFLNFFCCIHSCYRFAHLCPIQLNCWAHQAVMKVTRQMQLVPIRFLELFYTLVNKIKNNVVLTLY